MSRHDPGEWEQGGPGQLARAPDPLRSKYGPGAHLPHAWIERNGTQISTLDLAGRGCFALLCGHDGGVWEQAAAVIASEFGINLAASGIGVGLAYADTTGGWQRLREIGDGGCLLVRPDNFVAWRCMVMPPDPVQALREAIAQILGRGDDTAPGAEEKRAVAAHS